MASYLQQAGNRAQTEQPMFSGITSSRDVNRQIQVVFDAAANPVLHEESEVKNDYVRERISGTFAYRLVRKLIGALTVLTCCGAVHAQANGHERKAELCLRGGIVS